MTKCAVEECHGRSGHMFPKDPTIRRKWMEFAGRTSIGSYALLCKAHFRDEDFVSLPVIRGLPAPRKRLKPDAVPTIRENVPSIQEAAAFRTQFRSNKRQPTDYDMLAQIQLAKMELKKQDKNDVKVLSEKELLKVIEYIKQKLMDNAPETAEFPSTWNERPKKREPIREGYPPFSMPCLIALAIESTTMGIATKFKIIRFIGLNFPCYKLNVQRGRDWQARVGEILEACKVFHKVSAEESPNPEARVIFWTFSPDEKTVISTELYEAFTNSRFDDSSLDYESAAVRTDDDILPVRTEDMVVSRINDINEDLMLEHSDDRFSETNPSGSPRVDFEERIEEVERRIDRLKRLKERSHAEEEKKKKKKKACRRRQGEEEENVVSERDDERSTTGKDVNRAKRKQLCEEDEVRKQNDFDKVCSDENATLAEDHSTSDTDPAGGNIDQDSDESEEEVELTLYKCKFCKFVSLKDNVTRAHMIKTHAKEDSHSASSETCRAGAHKRTKLAEVPS